MILGAVCISVTGIGLNKQRSHHSIVTLEKSPPRIAVRIPLADDEQQ